MPETATTTQAAFGGYWRRRKPDRWERLAEGETYDEAWGRLLDKLRVEGLTGGESLVSTRDPNTPAPMRRRCF